MTDNRGAAALRQFLETSSQVDLANKTGISQSHVSRLARAEKTPKLLADAQALLEHAGIELAWWHEPAEALPNKGAAE
jgi:transcriptional regulator with XRE-family HTH domain